MALNIKLRASNYPTTAEIILKTSRVDKRDIRDLNLIKIYRYTSEDAPQPECLIIHDFGKMEKMILLTGSHTGDNAEADEIVLDKAVMSWSGKPSGYTTANGHVMRKSEAELIWNNRSFIGFFRKYDVHKKSEEEAYNYMLEFATGYKRIEP